MIESEITETIKRFLQHKTYEDYEILSYYYWDQVPWSCEKYHQLIGNLLDDDLILQLIKSLTPISRRPTKLRIDNDEEFAKEKISSIFVLITYYERHSNWRIITSNILNLFKNHELQYKILACKLLLQLNDKIDLDKTGLRQLFVDDLYSCLTYLPGKLMAQDPTDLIDISYQTLLEIDHNYTELVNRNLMSIDKVFNRFGESHDILHLELQYLQEIIGRLGIKVLITFNRINFLLNQILINTYTNELTITKILEIQYQVIEMFLDQDQQGKDLMYEYRFDFIGSWKIMTRFHNIDITRNYQILEKLSDQKLEMSI